MQFFSFRVSCRCFLSDSAFCIRVARGTGTGHTCEFSLTRLLSRRAEYLSHLPSYRMGISLRWMVSWADLHMYVFIFAFFSVIFLYGLTHERAFSELHDHHSAGKALRLGWRATRDVLRTRSWRPDYSHVEQVRLTYQPIT